MRWKHDYRYQWDWHRWFAWRPVSIVTGSDKSRVEEVIWLEWIERRLENENCEGWGYEYRRIE